AQLFGSNHCLFFMIGDPKQAIYSFRGADLFSYLRAKSETPNQYTLTSNYRSTPKLVKAFNAIFGRRPLPFGYQNIPYEPAVAARTEPDARTAPFHLWYLTREAEADLTRPIKKEAAVDRIVTAVVEEIIVLLSDSTSGWLPKHIAVLTRTHRQAQKVKTALAKRHVPAVLHSAGSVFKTREADELALVLRAVANPADPRAVRTALSTDLIGVTGAELCAYMEQPDEQWHHRWQQFDDYHQLWRQHGFYRMFSQLMAQEAVRPRLLTLADGERRLTNVLHLAELLHEAAVGQQLGADGLLKWLLAQRQNEIETEDAQKLRLESDAHAVRIITIHKSKGLQFDVVFCPFTWEGARTDDDAIAFHDPDFQDRLTLAIGPVQDPRHKQLALEEDLTENLRLMYVALTRARQRCYLAWGYIKDAELSAPAYLLHGQRSADDEMDWLTALKRKMSAMTDTQLIAELQALARQADGAIIVKPLPEPSATKFLNSYQSRQSLASREFKRQIRNQWRIASFSALTANPSSDYSDLPDHDMTARTSNVEEISPGKADNLFAFPKGVRAGLFFHDLLEHWDFANPDHAQRIELIRAKLEGHGFENHWLQQVDLMIARMAQSVLPSPDTQSSLRLVDVPMRHRVNEMEFYFPLRPITADQLRDTLRSMVGQGADRFHDHLDRMQFAPVEGFLKGYMDMVFEHNGRYYLVDWKSNHLGDTWADYDQEALQAVMGQDFYFLQYYLYVLALDQLLGQRVTDYDYERHFGGVYYFFLRGIQGPGHATGIYYDRPDSDRVAALKKLLIAPVPVSTH
ncbi:MAG: UvrD-helicase domain-containing protein, partial [Desulfobacteraceae bacterium]|nr:UvrD-helicase domain-containing protein [Desulfobacteraceae bacterium]